MRRGKGDSKIEFKVRDIQVNWELCMRKDGEWIGFMCVFMCMWHSSSSSSRGGGLTFLCLGMAFLSTGCLGGMAKGEHTRPSPDTTCVQVKRYKR